MAGTNIGAVYLDLRLNTREFQRGIASTSNLLEGMVGSFGGSLNSMERGFRLTVNRMIDNFNQMIRGITSANITVPSQLGGGTMNITANAVPNVTALARGGIVSAPTLALVGEAGKEAVLPLQNNTGWMADLAGVISDTMNGGGRQVAAPTSVVVQLDGQKLAEVLIDDLDNAKARRGL
ncbi:MAG: hypothetical protein FWE44_00355 [Defluviitaleaceae bacterium]|nr:hypothetical protein [Defluviitaleaceae bacterium]